MNELVQKIKELKKIGAKAIKFELETEHLSEDLLSSFSKLLHDLNMYFVVKIGGPTSFNDMYLCKKINADKIVVPMLDNPYAFEKSIETYERVFSNCQSHKRPEYFINMETRYSFSFLHEFFEMPQMQKVKGIVFGRSDMAASLGYQNVALAQGDLMTYAGIISKKCFENNKIFVIGGNICDKSFEFLNKVKKFDFYETRKVIFDKSVFVKESYSTRIKTALGFEILWLKYKKNCGLEYDAKRLENIENLLKLVK